MSRFFDPPSGKSTEWTLAYVDTESNVLTETKHFEEPKTFLEALDYFPMYQRWHYIAVQNKETKENDPT